MRQKLFSMRLDPETKALFEEAAAAEGLSISAFVRYSALKEARSVLKSSLTVSQRDKASSTPHKELMTS